jgi:hypothetical protein
VLLCLDSALRIAQPAVLGLAINDLLSQSYRGLLWLMTAHLGHLLVAAARQSWATRIQGRLQARRAAELVAAQLRRNETSVGPAPTAWQRPLEGFERIGSMFAHSGLSLVGALLLLGWYDWTLALLCLTLVLPGMLLGAAHRHRARLLDQQLEQAQHRAADSLAAGPSEDVHRWFETLAHGQMKLTDAAVMNFSVMQLFALGVLATSLVHYCLQGSPRAGDIFAVLQYELMFIAALQTAVPAAHELAQVGNGASARMREPR